MAIARRCFNLLIWLLVFLYIIVPLIVYLYPGILTSVIFFNLYYCPHYSQNFSDFPHYGLSPDSSRNFYLTNPAGHRLGVWQLEPQPCATDADFADKPLDGRPVLLYYHGNALNRGGRHMVDLYKRLLKENVHILALDYRGYGDSEGLPVTESDAIDDAEVLFNYATQQLGVKRLYMWGHSLGTGIVSHLAKRLSDSGRLSAVAGIVLESPFNNIRDGVRWHHFSLPYRLLPYFEPVFVDGVSKSGIRFDSDRHLATLSTRLPVLIIHAQDDRVVPIDLGRQLRDYLNTARGGADVSNVRFLELPAGRGYRHTHACEAPEVYVEFRRLLADTA